MEDVTNRCMSDLDRLGIKHQTDKSSQPLLRANAGYGNFLSYSKGKTFLPHDYLVKYEIFLESLRSKAFTMVEVGVGSGASLRMWKEYFPLARIVGIDIRPECKAFEEDRIEIIIADGETASPATYIQQMQMKPLLILDDGPHTYSSQKISLETLFPLLADEGYYIIEDLSNQMVAELQNSLKSLMLYKNTMADRFSYFVGKPMAERYVELNRDMVTFVSTFACILRKKSVASPFPTIFSGEEALDLTIDCKEPLRNAFAKFTLLNTCALAVLDDRKLYGIISSSDAKKYAIEDLSRPIAECCNRNPAVAFGFDAAPPAPQFLYYPVVDEANNYLGFAYMI